jgi:ubiquinone/menaquinone biosynthesis C-methylase UbiE
MSQLIGTSDKVTATAYRGDTAYDYDERRFVTPQGRLFSDLEFRQLRRVTKQLTPASRVLEIGCGTARFSQFLARQGFGVVATDPSPDMIALAGRKCAGLDNITFKQADGANLSFADETFDFVFAIRVTNQTESQEYALTMVREMIRVAQRGGRILVEFVNRRRPFATRRRNVRLSFAQIRRVARDAGGDVLHEAGVLVFSQSVLNRVPDALVPLWGPVERLAALGLWRWASRGYILMRKC